MVKRENNTITISKEQNNSKKMDHFHILQSSYTQSN